MSQDPEFSIVIPAYNEAENIGPAIRGIEAAVHGDYEIVVVHDFDEDTTIPALTALDPPCGRLRIVRNDVAPGPAGALRAGFASARGRLGCVVMMADLSDPAEAVNRMVERLRQGDDVVAGSRHMPGGAQIGGPALKRLLARWSGKAARVISGIGIHDLTSNFRAYSRRLIASTTIESEGFAVALELTVKCHLRGWRVGETPVTWRHRTAGKSRFRFWRWLPSYSRWFWTLFVRDPFGLGVRSATDRNRGDER